VAARIWRLPEMRDSYPPDLVTSTVAERTDIALFVKR
jgi:hypothetical protein